MFLYGLRGHIDRKHGMGDTLGDPMRGAMARFSMNNSSRVAFTSRKRPRPD
jgi:hypothetical protein